MKHILATTDGSEPALQAVAAAGEIAARFDADLLLLAVGTEPSAKSDASLQAYAASEHLRGNLRDLLPQVWSEQLEAAERVATRAGARHIQVATRFGDPVEQILAEIKASAIDLLVVGSRGRGRIGGLLLGSVSQALVGRAPCSVLVVRPSA